MLSIALVDDHNLFRKSFAFFIESVCGINVCMQAENGVDLLNQLQASAQHPKIILADIQMPVMNGRELTLMVKKLYPDIKIIALSMLHHEDTVIDMFRCGVKGFMTKNIEPDGLIKALNTVVNNKYFLFDGVTENIFSSSYAIHHNKTEHCLTGKQIEFLQLCASNMPYKVIAEKLKISPRTVDAYRDHLFEKLEIESRVELVLYAVQNGFVDTL